jgi:hypothetical protein
MRTTGEDIDFGKDLRHPCRARTVTAADINATGNSTPGPGRHSHPSSRAP